jgi:hypothetical protein
MIGRGNPCPVAAPVINWTKISRVNFSLPLPGSFV